MRGASSYLIHQNAFSFDLTGSSRNLIVFVSKLEGVFEYLGEKLRIEACRVDVKTTGK